MILPNFESRQIQKKIIAKVSKFLLFLSSHSAYSLYETCPEKRNQEKHDRWNIHILLRLIYKKELSKLVV
tara:strand:+ start:1025 stop:1234 length:210 start_codon:yes stop_codon:yes gene_type:complete